MNKIITTAAELFFSDKSHAKAEKVFITRDGQPFYEWHDANEHSKTLGSNESDRKIEEVLRTDIVTEKKGK